MRGKLGTNRKRFARAVGALVIVAAAGMALHRGVSTESTSPPVSAAGVVALPLGANPFERLSEYNLFEDFATQTPSPGVLPYDIATPLFTDYASKHRFVYIPEGTAAQYDPESMFEYPVGTILVKTFGYLNDIRDESLGEELIETRLLVRDGRGWNAWTYVYDEAVEDAVLTVDGATREMTWIHHDGQRRRIDYIVPTSKDCQGCHNERYNVVPIGPKAWSLNRDFEYDHGTENQLALWSRIGILEGAPEPENALSLPLWDDKTHGTLDQRARAYLEVNCAHCHNPNGPANDSGLDLRWSQDDPYALGVGRRLAVRNDGQDERRGEEGDRIRGERRRDDGGRGRDERRRNNRDGERDDRRRDNDDDRDERRRGFDREQDEPDFGEGDFDPEGRVFDIVPGKPDESIMVFRMESLVPEVTMPKVPHRLIHEEGVALIRAWILAMDEIDPEEPTDSRFGATGP